MEVPDEPADRGRRERALRAARATLRVAAAIAVAGIGALAAVAAFGQVHQPIGPFDTTLAARPGTSGTQVQVAPFGRIDVDSHDGPLGLELTVDQLRVADAEAIAEDPESFDLDEDELAGEVRDGVTRLAQRIALCAVLGGAAAGFVRRRRWQAALGGGLVGAVAVGATMGMAVRTWEPESLAQPRYSGLLARAPQAVGDARDVIDRFEDYRAQLAGLIENVGTLYQGASDARSFRADASTVRVLHVSDLHLNPQGFDLIDQVVAQFGIDVVVDTGDINDWGTPIEARFVERIGDLGVPYVYIRGNHDSAATARAVAAQPNAVVLDDDTATVAGLTFWGEGDPRFTPDKSAKGSGDDEHEVAEEQAPIAARRLQAVDRDVDVALVHDPTVADDLGGLVPLVLAGHRHRADEIDLGEGTRLLVEGSTGGAGLRSLQRDDPVPLTASVLYFDADTGELQAQDRIEVAGVDQAEVRIEREVFDPGDEETTADRRADDEPGG
ncbi:MAG TPA: metallophosphoesterase [Aquihabitans sp.]|nr:metallophosphoesterase [Aquihabitans sp.]